MKNLLWQYEKNLYLSKSKGYGKIMVRDVVEDGEDVRLLMVNYARESACFNESGRHDELIFKYTKQFENAFRINPNIKDTLLIGGAGFSYPKYYLSHHKDSNIDVVELNQEIIDVAHKYFYLDEYIAKHATNANGEPNGRLNIYNDEGMKFIANCEKKYDLIINDAYIGNVLDNGLMSYRGVALVKRHLNSKGIYFVNIITALNGFYANEGNMAREVFAANFKNVYFYSIRPSLNKMEKQNCVLIGTDEKIPELEIL